ncbi:MAG: IS1 family transposase [Acidobacteria bacterium]|nr:IS1 family transposase [Acidobacteriota bacterium]
MHQCPHCSTTERQTKAGRTRTGSQRYKCRECQRVYTPEPKPLGYPEETRREAVRLYLEGTNFRRIGRVLEVNHQSVVNWINSYHAALPEASQAVDKPETLEMDELFTFVGSKKRKPTSSPSLTEKRGASLRGRSVRHGRRS